MKKILYILTYLLCIQVSEVRAQGLNSNDSIGEIIKLLDNKYHLNLHKCGFNIKVDFDGVKYIWISPNSISNNVIKEKNKYPNSERKLIITKGKCKSTWHFKYFTCCGYKKGKLIYKKFDDENYKLAIIPLASLTN